MLARTLIALVSGGALTLAFQPYGVSVLVPICLAGLLLATYRLPVRRAWLPGLLFGLAFMGSLQSWIIAIGPDAWAALSLIEALFFAVLGAGLALVQRLPFWPLWVATIWVAIESVRVVWPFSGMPWGRLSYAVADSAWAQLLPYIGFTLVSFLLALTGGLLAWLLVGGWRRPVLALSALTAVAVIPLGAVLVPYQPEAVASATVGVVQGGVPGDGTNILLDHRQVTSNQRTVTEEVAADVAAGRSPQPDLIVWPENSTAVDPFLDAEVNATITAASDAIGVPILVGAITEGAQPGTVLNQGIVWEPGVGAKDRYTKWHPVPFGEYIPWRGQGPMERFQNFGRLREIGRDMPAGNRQSALQVGKVRVADAICFDVAYDDVFAAQLRDGAQMIVVQTSNALFINTEQLGQQFEITRLRALASGRALAVASTNGVSGLVAPTGEVIAQAGIRSSASLVADVPLVEDIPPGVLLGAWPAWLLSAAALIASAAALLGVGRRVPYPQPRPSAETSGAERDLVGAGPPADHEGRS